MTSKSIKKIMPRPKKNGEMVVHEQQVHSQNQTVNHRGYKTYTMELISLVVHLRKFSYFKNQSLKETMRIAKKFMEKRTKETLCKFGKECGIGLGMIFIFMIFLPSESIAALATQVGKVHSLFKDHIIKTGLVIGCGVGGISALLKGSFGGFISILAVALALSFALSLIEGGEFMTLFSK